MPARDFNDMIGAFKQAVHEFVASVGHKQIIVGSPLHKEVMGSIKKLLAQKKEITTQFAHEYKLLTGRTAPSNVKWNQTASVIKDVLEGYTNQNNIDELYRINNMLTGSRRKFFGLGPRVYGNGRYTKSEIERTMRNIQMKHRNSKLRTTKSLSPKITEERLASLNTYINNRLRRGFTNRSRLIRNYYEVAYRKLDPVAFNTKLQNDKKMLSDNEKTLLEDLRVNYKIKSLETEIKRLEKGGTQANRNHAKKLRANVQMLKSVRSRPVYSTLKKTVQSGINRVLPSALRYPSMSFNDLLRQWEGGKRDATMRQLIMSKLFTENKLPLQTQYNRLKKSVEMNIYNQSKNKVEAHRLLRRIFQALTTNSSVVKLGPFENVKNKLGVSIPTKNGAVDLNQFNLNAPVKNNLAKSLADLKKALNNIS